MTSSPVKWNSRVRLVDEVLEVLRDRIFRGDFPPGSRLRQDALAEELQVSRTPLREALRMLEQEGLVRVDPRQGVRVVTGDTSTLLAAYQLRDVVDGLAARLAAETSDSDYLEVLHQAIDDQRVALAPWDAEQYTTANIQFHSCILEMSGNEFLVGQIPLLRMTARIFSPVSLIDRSAAEVAIPQHEGILHAIEAGQSTLAETCARDHINTTIRRLEKLVASEDADA